LVYVSLGRDRFSQNVVRRAEKLPEGLVAEAGDFCRRMQPRAEKNFVRVNIPNARDQFLIE